MVITVSHQQYRESLRKQSAESVEQCLGRHVARTHGFESRVWSDAELSRITSEGDAIFLFQQSTTLEKEFRLATIFLAYWKRLKVSSDKVTGV